MSQNLKVQNVQRVLKLAPFGRRAQPPGSVLMPYQRKMKSNEPFLRYRSGRTDGHTDMSGFKIPHTGLWPSGEY